jgi:beta-phosphoglucomutase-like phosphatase (HAD superfamily)
MADSTRILLFDIDGTLVSTGGAGAVAWRRAFADLYGIPTAIAVGVASSVYTTSSSATPARTTSSLRSPTGSRCDPWVAQRP